MYNFKYYRYWFKSIHCEKDDDIPSIYEPELKKEPNPTRLPSNVVKLLYMFENEKYISKQFHNFKISKEVTHINDLFVSFSCEKAINNILHYINYSIKYPRANYYIAINRNYVEVLKNE